MEACRLLILDDDETIGMTWFLWLGGLDTVASTISQMFRRLALDQRTIALDGRRMDGLGRRPCTIQDHPHWSRS